MANLTGTGAPSTTIQAAIGDIYTDESTGKKYKCTFAYRSVESEKFVSQWKELKTDTKTNIVINGKKIGEAVSKPIESPANMNSEPEKIPGEKIEKKEEIPVNLNQQSNKNYTNYSKPKNQ